MLREHIAAYGAPPLWVDIHSSTELESYPQNYRWQNGKVWFLILLHLKVALPRRIEESSSRRKGRVSSRRRLCRSSMVVKFSFLLIREIFREIFNFGFCEIREKFGEIQNYIVKISRNTKFWQHNFEFSEIWGKFSQNTKLKISRKRKFRSHPTYVGVVWGGGELAGTALAYPPH